MWVKQLQRAIGNALLVHRREQTSLLGRIQIRLKRVYDGDLIQFGVVGIIIANFLANVVEYELMSTEPDTVQLFNDLDLSFTIIFTVELVANMIAHADMLPLPFLGDGWNILDIIVVAVSLVTAGNLLGGQSSSIKTIRILRAFRVVSIHPQPPSVPVAALAAMCLHACIACVCVCVCVCVCACVCVCVCVSVCLCVCVHALRLCMRLRLCNAHTGARIQTADLAAVDCDGTWCFDGAGQLCLCLCLSVCLSV